MIRKHIVFKTGAVDKPNTTTVAAELRLRSYAQLTDDMVNSAKFDAIAQTRIELAEQIEDEIFGEARKELIELERAVMPRLQPCQYGKVSDRFTKLHKALK